MRLYMLAATIRKRSVAVTLPVSSSTSHSPRQVSVRRTSAKMRPRNAPTAPASTGVKTPP